MAGGQEKWYFSKDQLQNSASRKCGLDADKELAYRQQAANLIQDMGQRLQVSQLCINTAIVYMHRFYAFHSFTQFHRNAIAAAALFLAAKVEEQPRKLEYVIKVAHVCVHRGEGVSALTTDQYQEQAQDLVFNENVLLQTLGFDVAIDHPHTHVVRACHLVKAPKDLAQTSYFMASNSLHLTTMCLQYRPTVVACFCIHLASKWSNWAIPQSNEGRHWFSYVDRTVTSDLLERLTAEFLHIFDKCPSRLKRKMMERNSNSGSSPHSSAAHGSSSASQQRPSLPNDDFDKSFDKEYERERRRAPATGGYVPAAPAAPPPNKIDYNAYREKRERDERERARQQQQPSAARQPGQQQPPGRPAAPHHRPHHHKPPPWPHHKPPHKPAPPASASAPAPAPPPPPAPAPPAAPARTRPPSLFSPDNTAPAHAAQRPAPPRRPAASPRRVLRDMQPPAILSPFSSPPAVSVASAPAPEPSRPRQRVHSNSEPELVPVVKKLDETPGYENVIRDSQRGTSIRTKPQEQRRPEPAPARSLNGIETDPTLVSNLLKESLAKPAPITVATERKSPAVEVKREPVVEPKREPVEPVVEVKREPDPAPAAPQPVQPAAEDAPDHKHKKEKKKKEKHKHKDRDKSKEERKKHKKDKERERKEGRKESPPPAPAEPATDGALRITIPREKLASSPGLKIKIPKERLAAPPPPPQAAGLKIKISKEVLETSRKRAGEPPGAAPPHKLARHNGAPHPKVGWPLPPPAVPRLPYYMVRPPPPLYYNMAMSMGGMVPMEGYYYGPPLGVYAGHPPGPPAPPAPPGPPQPPLPAMPPPVVPPPPPE
ncbi:LOW QUALITY PROTEIN: cyclin-T-like [Cydia splendana]|uniref:LOW QUALITY PROTEIN: cyclin-T-like n=1 Tax=Cydia splendana TaxID=1100963 RepID=UPI00300CEFF6